MKEYQDHKEDNLGMVCEHDKDKLIDDARMKLYREVAFNRYYVNELTHEIFCSCGEEADFPHRCKCKKCGVVVHE